MQCSWILQNTSSTVSELLREIQKGRDKITPPPPSSQISVDEYGENTSCGSEISWCIVGVSKIFLMKIMKYDNLELKLEEAKIPSKCTFLKTKKSI